MSTSIAEKSCEAETSMACRGICAQRTGGGIHCLVGQDKRRSNGYTAKRPRMLGSATAHQSTLDKLIHHAYAVVLLVLALGGGSYAFD